MAEEVKGTVPGCADDGTEGCEEKVECSNQYCEATNAQDIAVIADKKGKTFYKVLSKLWWYVSSWILLKAPLPASLPFGMLFL